MENQDLPQGWINTTILDCCLLNNKEKINDEVEVAFIPMANVGTGYFDEAIFENKLWKEVKKGYTQFQDKDVLVAKITPCFENGKAALVDNLPNGFGAGSTEYFVLRAKNNILPSFLYSLIKDRQFLIQGEINMIGSVGHRRVPKEFIENYPIRLPPLAEQKEIVRVVESHLKLVDQIKSRLDALPKILEQFRQSVLASAVSGKLTGVDIAELGELSNLVNIISGVAFKKAEYSDSGYRLLQIANVTNNKTIWDSQQFISEKLAKSNSAYILELDDIVLALNRPIIQNLVKVSSIKSDDLPAILYQRVARLRQNNTNQLDSKFLYLFMLSPDFKKFVENNLKGSDQPYLNTSLLQKMIISAPSTEEQKEIVGRVENLFALADQIEAKVKNAQERVNLLTQSILAKAFRGELTAKWREENPDLISGDNSAEALLKRIEAEKKKSKKK